VGRTLVLILIPCLLCLCSSFNSNDFKSQVAFEQKRYTDYNNATYLFSNDSLKQTLTIKLVSKNQVQFELVSENIKRNKIFKLNGIANLASESDSESDEDEDGNGFFVDEFKYSNQCTLYFRLDADEFKRARIKMHNCLLKNNYSTPIKSLGIMHRIK